MLLQNLTFVTFSSFETVIATMETIDSITSLQRRASVCNHLESKNHFSRISQVPYPNGTNKSKDNLGEGGRLSFHLIILTSTAFLGAFETYQKDRSLEPTAHKERQAMLWFALRSVSPPESGIEL